MSSRLKKEKNTPIISITNHRREIKLVPVSMDYCQFQFDALKFL